jgi:hypothetical protein
MHGSAKALLGLMTLRNILGGAMHKIRLSQSICCLCATAVYVPYLAIRPDQAIFYVVGFDDIARAHERLLRANPVIRMRTGQGFLDTNGPPHRLHTKDTIMFIGPLQLARGKIPCPATDVRDMLRLGEHVFTCAEGRFLPLKVGY